MRFKVSCVAAVALAAGSVANAQSLTTLFASDNGGGAGGVVFFDVSTSAQPLTVVGLYTNTSAAAGTTFGVTVYTAIGSYVNNELNPGAWTQVATGVGTAAGQDIPSRIVLDAPFELTASSGFGMAIVLAAPGQISAAHRYTNGTGANQFYNNDDVFLSLGAAANTPFVSAPFANRVWNGTLYYAAGSNTAGACCLDDGTCQVVTATDCFMQNGIFRGGNTTCATANCPQPGACCRYDGSCFIASAAGCAQAGGTFGGDNTTCATTPCVQPGACCLANGGCVLIHEADCTTAGGTFQGAGSSCSAGDCWSPPVVWHSGSMITHIGTGFNGADVSELPAGANTIGENCNLTAGVRLAQEIIVPAGESWTLTKFTTYAYQTGAPSSGTMTDLVVRIWDDDPRNPSAMVVWGDITTNIRDASQSGFANAYRTTTGTGQLNTDRALQRVVGNLPNVQLGAGSYWVEWSTRGSLASGPFMPPVTAQDFIPWGRALIWRNAPWVPVVDSTYNAAQFPGGQPVGLPFIIEGTTAQGCYANCDNSTTPPILNVDDFTCFINQFAAAQALPHAQQVAHYANCDGSTIAPVLNVDDFTCFINEYAQGCP